MSNSEWPADRLVVTSRKRLRAAGKDAVLGSGLVLAPTPSRSREGAGGKPGIRNGTTDERRWTLISATRNTVRGVRARPGPAADSADDVDSGLLSAIRHSIPSSPCPSLPLLVHLTPGALPVHRHRRAKVAAGGGQVTSSPHGGPTVKPSLVPTLEFELG